MSVPKATQTFKDAQGRHFIEGVEVPQAAYNLHEWVTRAEIAEAAVVKLRAVAHRVNDQYADLEAKTLAAQEAKDALSEALDGAT